MASAFPGSQYVAEPYSINNSGEVVGGYEPNVPSNYAAAGFLFDANFTTISPQGAIYSIAVGISNSGQIVGFYGDSQGFTHGFLASGPALLDPVPDLLQGAAVTSQNLPAKGLLGRPVKGVAADGVTQVLVRIPASNIGDQFMLTLLNDQNAQSNSSDEDGAIGNPGDTTFSQSQLTVNAVGVTTSNNQQAPYAFAVYRAPIDFARQNSDGSYKPGTCRSTANTDDNLACRTVSLRIQDLTQGTTATLPITILRPPVVMIHGLWDNWQTWNNFTPLVTGPTTVDPRFSIGRTSYDTPIGAIVTGTDPFYSITLQANIQANSLGFAYSAPNVQQQIDGWIKNFKGGQNPLRIAAAAVQADVVAHSMGGDITRTIVLQPTFLSNDTFRQGSIHKVITIDTPHLGSPLAIQLLQPQEDDGCLQKLLAGKGKFVLNAVNFSDFSFSNGAMADLQGDDTTRKLSQALQDLNGPITHPLPTALIAGIYTNFAALDSSVRAFALRNLPYLGCPSDPLAQQLTSTGWPQIFHNNPNDAIVSENSQLNGLIPDPDSQFFGYVHSAGTEKLGFAGPSVLDAGPVPNQVISLLNTPWTNSVYYYLLGP